MIKHVCDVCGKEIGPENTAFPMGGVNLSESVNGHTGVLDVCIGCRSIIQGRNETFFESVFNILRNGMKSQL
jgi:hypothetical protein